LKMLIGSTRVPRVAGHEEAIVARAEILQAMDAGIAG
jgi:hypothetical protein